MIKRDLEKYKVLTSYNLHQLELDYLQNLALKVLYDKYSTLYFKGGTCLKKCYGIKITWMISHLGLLTTIGMIPQSRLFHLKKNFMLCKLLQKLSNVVS